MEVHRTAFASAPCVLRSSISWHGICSINLWNYVHIPARRARNFRMGVADGDVSVVAESVLRRTGTPKDVSVVLLAGGVGKRMGSSIPKQLLPLRGRSVLERSLEVFIGMPEIAEVVVVLDVSLRDTPIGRACKEAGAVFADPGIERADSVRSGCGIARNQATLICVHDAARPLVRPQAVRAVLNDAWLHGAAALAVPCKATIKSSDDGAHVANTLDRSRLWEMQTPQCIDAALLRRALDEAHAANAEITDDVSAVERLDIPVRLTMGHYDNVKITTPEDLVFADAVLRASGDGEV